MRRIKQVLPAAMESPEVMRVARALAVLKRWDEVVGGPLADRSWPDRYTSGTVWVAVEGAAWANELRMMKEDILQRLKDISGEPQLFANVRFGQRKLPERPVPLKKQEEPELKSTTEMSIREIAERRLAKLRAQQNGDA
jgi:predicted nucleic acid-binding Zn ribbon protein